MNYKNRKTVSYLYIDNDAINWNIEIFIITYVYIFENKLIYRSKYRYSE